MKDECEECGGMGITIGFLGDKKIAYKCETCCGKPNPSKGEDISILGFKARKKKKDST